MPETDTATGFQKKITEAVPGINRRRAQRLAYKVKRRAERMADEFDFYASLKILGLIPDPTAREALYSLELDP